MTPEGVFLQWLMASMYIFFLLVILYRPWGRALLAFAAFTIGFSLLGHPLFPLHGYEPWHSALGRLVASADAMPGLDIGISSRMQVGGMLVITGFWLMVSVFDKRLQAKG